MSGPTGSPMSEAENPFAGQGAVLLDIGGDVGALVVSMPDELVGLEVEIRPRAAVRPAHAHGHHPHVAVVSRPTLQDPVPSLVFPELVADTYELSEKGDPVVYLTATVAGGAVTEATWPWP